jgi:hypothetical protein
MFRSFRSTITPFLSRRWNAALNLLVDPVTGAPVGIQSPNDNGADGIWTPLDISAAQVTNPTAAMMADLNATYRLNVPPYTRYQSNGLDIVALSGANIQGPGGLLGVMIAYAPVTITDPAGVSIQGTVSVRNLP